MNQIQRENTEFLINILKNTNIFQKDAYDFFINGNDRTLGIKNYIGRVVDGTERYSNENFNSWFPKIIMAMNNFLDDFDSIPSYKQTVYERFYEWCKSIANSVWNYENLIDIIGELEPPTYDPAIYLIKKMHGEGVSKKDVSDQFQVKNRTVWNNIRRLDVKNKGKVPPLRIGGQPVYVDIETEEKEDDYPTGSRYLERTYYRTPNSMHPFVMQYNVTQAMILLKSLYLYQKETDSQICYKMAVDAWSQLSEYGKEKIIEKFGRRDLEFCDFLNELMDWECGNKVIVFEPEEEFLKEGSSLPLDEKVTTACKSEAVCSIIFKDLSKGILYDQRILYDNKNYYAVPCKEVEGLSHIGSSEKYYLSFDEIEDIIK